MKKNSTNNENKINWFDDMILSDRYIIDINFNDKNVNKFYKKIKKISLRLSILNILLFVSIFIQILICLLVL